MMTKKEKDEYWEIVAECLISFHRMKRREANRKAEFHREEIERSEPNINIDIFYHNEPFEVACNIAEDHSLDLGAVFPEYEKILEGKRS